MKIRPLAKTDRFLPIQFFPLCEVALFARPEIPLLHRVRHRASRPVAPIHIHTRRETSSANDRADNESSSAHKTNSSAATWTTPTPIIVPQKPHRRPASTQPAHLANRVPPQQIRAHVPGRWVPHPQLSEGAGLTSTSLQSIRRLDVRAQHRWRLRLPSRSNLSKLRFFIPPRFRLSTLYCQLSSNSHRRRIPHSTRHQLLNLPHRPNPPARPHRHTIQRRRRTPKIQMPLHPPPLHQPINKSRVKNISRPNRVHHIHPIRRRIPKPLPIPSQHALITKVAAANLNPYVFQTSGSDFRKSFFPVSLPGISRLATK